MSLCLYKSLCVCNCIESGKVSMEYSLMAKTCRGVHQSLSTAQQARRRVVTKAYRYFIWLCHATRKMLVQASWTEEGRVVFRLYRTGAEAANGIRLTRHLNTLVNVKSAFLARIFIPFRRREFTKPFTVSSRTKNAHAQTVYVS